MDRRASAGSLGSLRLPHECSRLLPRGFGPGKRTQAEQDRLPQIPRLRLVPGKRDTSLPAFYQTGDAPAPCGVVTLREDLVLTSDANRRSSSSGLRGGNLRISMPSSTCPPAGVLLREFYKVFGMPGEGPPDDLDLAVFESVFPVEEGDRYDLQRSLGDDGLRRMHRECSETVESLMTAMSGDALLVELSEGPRLTSGQFDRLTAGSLWYSLVSSLDKRDHAGLPVLPPQFSGHEMPLEARFKMTVFGSLVLKLYIALVFIREGDLARLTAEAARARKPVSGRLLKLLRADFVRHVRNSLAHGTFEQVIVGIRFSDGDKIVTATPRFLDHLSTCLSVAQLQAAAAGLRRVKDH